MINHTEVEKMEVETEKKADYPKVDIDPTEDLDGCNAVLEANPHIKTEIVEALNNTTLIIKNIIEPLDLRAEVTYNIHISKKGN